MTDIRGLSLYQPYASLVAIGAKQIETRSWATIYRGWLAIHASKSLPLAARLSCQKVLSGGVRNPIYWALSQFWATECNDSTWPPPASFAAYLPRGAIVAIAKLMRLQSTNEWPTVPGIAGWVRRLSDQERAFGDYSPSRYGWMLSDVHRLIEPIPCKGTLGLWRVPFEIIAQIQAQLPGVLR